MSLIFCENSPWKVIIAALMRFITLLIFAAVISSPAALAATHDVVPSDADYLLQLKKLRDSWVWGTPGSAIVWKVYVDQADEARKLKDYEKEETLLAAALEHCSLFKTDDSRRIQTVEKLKACAKARGHHIEEKQIEDLILPLVHESQPKYKMRNVPPAAAYPPTEPQIQEADHLVVEGESEKAAKIYRKVLKSLRERHTRHGHEIVKIVDRLTRIYYAQARYGDAEALVRTELKQSESMWDRLDPHDPEKLQLAFMLGDLALAYSGVDRFIECEALDKTALKIIHTNLSEHHYDYIVTLGELARIHKLMGKFNEAEKEYKTALALSKNHSDVSNQARGVMFGNYAKLLQKMGKTRMAKEMEERSTSLLAGYSAKTPGKDDHYR